VSIIPTAWHLHRYQVLMSSMRLATIESMSATLTYLHTLATTTNAFQLNYHLYLTCPPAPLPFGPPPSLPPTTQLSPYRPSISQLVRESLPPPTFPELEYGMDDTVNAPRTCCSLGGMAVVACGPEGIVTESRNAVASLSVGERVRCGGVDFHGECYTL
jgi:ferric-chelate reductase